MSSDRRFALAVAVVALLLFAGIVAGASVMTTTDETPVVTPTPHLVKQRPTSPAPPSPRH